MKIVPLLVLHINILLSITSEKEFNKKKEFVINLKEIDSSKSLLSQIIERATDLGFNFQKSYVSSASGTSNTAKQSTGSTAKKAETSTKQDNNKKPTANKSQTNNKKLESTQKSTTPNKADNTKKQNNLSARFLA